MYKSNTAAVLFGLVCGFAIGCGDNSVVNPETGASAITTGTGTGGHSVGGSGHGGSAGGTTATGGHHHMGGGSSVGGHHAGGGGGAGGSGGSAGAGGHAGGAVGGNPCSDVPVDHAVIKFETGKHDGVLAFGAWINNPFYPAKNVPWGDPFNGCIAKTSLDLTIGCDFGAGLSGNKIYFIVNVHPSADVNSKAVAWFSKDLNGKIETTGTYYACHGNTLVGSFKNGAYAVGGVLVPSDEKDHPQNLMFVVP